MKQHRNFDIVETSFYGQREYETTHHTIGVESKLSICKTEFGPLCAHNLFNIVRTEKKNPK
jgi:hypothetical protein